MTAVADASVLVAALTDSGEEGRWAEAALASGELLAGPELVLVEATNALRRMEITGIISPRKSTDAHRNLLRLDLALFPFAPFAERVWELRDTISSYDAWYVALAEALACPLLTLDRRLERSPGPRCPIIAPPLRDALAPRRGFEPRT